MLDARLGFGKTLGASWRRENEATDCPIIALPKADTPLRASMFFPGKMGIRTEFMVTLSEAP